LHRWRVRDYFALMHVVRTGLLILLLPLLLAAAPVKPSSKPPGPAKAASGPSDQPQSAAAVPGEGQKTYPPQSIAFPGGVTMTREVYSQLKGFRPLTLDLYVSNSKGSPRPGLIFVHGGDWNSGDTRHAGRFGDFPGLLAALAARGMVVASIDYRLSGEARFPAALQDTKTAIRWMRAHAGNNNLDPTRVAVWGADAGGYLAAMAGVSCGVALFEPVSDPGDKPPSDCVQAVIDWYGVTDFEAAAADLGKNAPDKSAAGDFLGCEPALCPVGMARNASPLTYIQTMAPPFLIQHGAGDDLVSPKQSQKLNDALRAKNVPAELIIYPGVGHDFAPAANSGPDASDPAADKEIVEKLEAFLDATFPANSAGGPSKPVNPKSAPY
jgi:acetyl esterase/lipase